MTGRQWLALAVVGSGAVGLTAMVLYARGRQQEAFALSFTAGLVSTALGAAQALAEDSPGLPRAGVAAKPAAGAVGVAGVRWPLF